MSDLSETSLGPTQLKTMERSANFTESARSAMMLFIRGQLFHLNGVDQLLWLADMNDASDKGRRIDLGQIAYEAYQKRLAEYQSERTLSWDRFPPYMRDVWTAVAEAVIEHESPKLF